MYTKTPLYTDACGCVTYIAYVTACTRVHGFSSIAKFGGPSLSAEGASIEALQHRERGFLDLFYLDLDFSDFYIRFSLEYKY